VNKLSRLLENGSFADTKCKTEEADFQANA